MKSRERNISEEYVEIDPFFKDIEESRVQSEVDDLKKKGAWDIILKFIAKYNDNWSTSELQKLNSLLYHKCGISIGEYALKCILMDVIGEANKIIREREIMLELESFEKELMIPNKSSPEYGVKLIQLKEKIQNWKEEGYDVSELEKKLKALEI